MKVHKNKKKTWKSLKIDKNYAQHLGLWYLHFVFTNTTTLLLFLLARSDTKVFWLKKVSFNEPSRLFLSCCTQSEHSVLFLQKLFKIFLKFIRSLKITKTGSWSPWKVLECCLPKPALTLKISVGFWSHSVSALDCWARPGVTTDEVAIWPPQTMDYQEGWCQLWQRWRTGGQ